METVGVHVLEENLESAVSVIVSEDVIGRGQGLVEDGCAFLGVVGGNGVHQLRDSGSGIVSEALRVEVELSVLVESSSEALDGSSDHGKVYRKGVNSGLVGVNSRQSNKCK